MRFDSSATVVRVTWQGVFSFGTSDPCTFQYQFFPSGQVNIIWQSMTLTGNGHVVGYNTGGAADPGNRDISATRGAGWTVCNSATSSLALSVSARPVLGTTFNFVTSNIPVGTSFGAVVISFSQAIPPVNLASIGSPGCFSQIVVGTGNTYLFLSPGATQNTPFTLPNIGSFAGVPLVAQSFTYSPPATPSGIISSNGQLMLIGVL